MYEPNKRPYGIPLAAEVPALVRSAPPPYMGHPGHSTMEEQDGFAFDPLKLLWFIVHYRWMIVGFLVTGLVTGILGTYIQTPLYRSTVQIEVLTQGARAIQDLEVVTQSSDIRAFETARTKMESRDLARRVVFELNLTEDAEFLAPTPRFSLLNLIDRITGTKRRAALENMTPEEREQLAVAIVRDGLSAELLRNTSILAVTFTHASPKHTALVANQAAASFIDQTVDRTSETSDLARQFIEEQVAETKQKLQASEKALVDYAKEQGITLTGTDASLISENMAKLNAALAEAIQERLEAERYNQQVVDGKAANLPEVFKSDSIQETKAKISELRATYQEKLATLKPGFPEMQRIRAQISELQKQIDAEIASIATTINIRLDQAKEREAGLKRELAELELQQRDFQDKNIQYTILKREVDSSRVQYDALISKRNEIGIGSDLKSTNAAIIDPAVQPNGRFSPSLVKTVGLVLVLFAAMCGALIYLLELMNNTFAIPDQIESELKVPALGIIPEIKEEDLLESFKDNKSAISEAYRSLRTSLQFTGTEGAMRSILVTSSEPSEGKSSTVYKLAHDFAALGRSVLVIDADLRKPRQHRLFNTDNSIGLSNLLSNVVRNGSALNVFRKTPDPNVTLLPAGTIPPNPSDLLMSQRMALTLHFCTKKYDLVIIDSPPVMGLSDTPILSRQADATLLVVAAKQVSRKAAQSALARLRNSGGNVIGAVLTKFAVNNLDYNYAYRYMQYNYYGYDQHPSEQLENHAKSSKGKPKGRLDILRTFADKSRDLIRKFG